MMDHSSYLSTPANVSTNPLWNELNVLALKSFEDIIRTCVGPSGKLKVVQNASGGQVTATSSSQRLFNIISIQNIFLKLIVASTKVHLKHFIDSGLCCSLLTVKIINNSLYGTYPFSVMGKLFEYFGKLFTEYLNIGENPCVLNMDSSNLANFQSVVLTILKSKPGCILREEDLQHLSVLLIKMHLNCLPSRTSSICHKNFNFVTLESVHFDKSCLYEGLLIRLSDIHVKKVNFFSEQANVKIVLFSSSLSGDVEFPVDKIETKDIDVWDSILSTMRNAVDTLIKSKINVLFSQKVVHPSIKKQLEDANVLVFDRLGYEAARHLEYMSGAVNSSLFDKVTYGYLTKLKQVSIGKNEFILLANDQRPFWTLLICNINEQTASETKVVCQQATETLFRLLKKPLLCFGGGCTEIYTSKILARKVLQSVEDIKLEIGCTTSQIFEALQIFLQSISDVAVAFHQGSKLNFCTEFTFGHLWKLKDNNFPSPKDKCSCGLISSSEVHSTSWRMFANSVNMTVDTTDFQYRKAGEYIDKSVILDELSSKVNAYSVAFQTASLLLRTSVCLYY